MLVAFQRKLMYLNNVPIGCRTETLTINDLKHYNLNIKSLEFHFANKRNFHLNGLDISNNSPVRPIIIFYLQG